MSGKLNGNQRFLFKITRIEDRIAGWLINKSEPERSMTIEVRVNNRKVAQLLCADRVDWREIAIRRDELPPTLMEHINDKPILLAGFEFRIPNCFSPLRKHRIQVFVIVNDERILLWRNESNLSESAIAGLQNQFADYVFVFFDKVLPNTQSSADELVVEGWISTPPGAIEETAANALLWANDQAFDTRVERLSGSPDPLHFSFWPDRPFFSFTARGDLGSVRRGKQGYQLVLRDASGMNIATDNIAYYLPADWKEILQTWNVPPLQGISRTTPTIARLAKKEGSTFVRSSYFFSGYTDLCQIEKLIEKHTGRNFDDMSEMLDWGCGCARLVRHMGRLEGIKAYGADIDPENIEWSQHHIDDVDFVKSCLDPPLPFKDNQFDLITGLSVYTHLTQADQFTWLKEHCRLLKPRGILAVTIASMNSLKRGGLRNRIDMYRDLSAAGIVDRIGYKFGDLLVDRPTYYRNTAHRHDYIYENWSRYFEIAAIVPGAAAGQQDLVIGVKP